MERSRTIEEYNEQKKVNNPHDKIFRMILEDKTQVAELINRCLKLKEKIKPKHLEIYNSSFIDQKFNNQECDIVYKKKRQQIFFLIEHQSKIDYSMPKRILKYQIAIMEMAMKNKKIIKKNEKLPLVIPIVIYTGTGKWNVAKYIKDCQEQLEGLDNMDLGSYVILDSNEYTKQELLEDKLFILKMMALEKTKNPDELYDNLEEITQKEIEKINRDILIRVIKYIYNETLGEEKTKDIINKLERAGDKEMIIEVIKKDREQQWLKGRIVGMQEGRQEGEKIGERRGEKLGIAKAITQMVKEMIRSNLSDEQIMKITKIEEKELEKLKMA